MNMMSEVIFLFLTFFVMILSYIKVLNKKSTGSILFLIVIFYLLFVFFNFYFSKVEQFSLVITKGLTFSFESSQSILLLEILSISFYTLMLLSSRGSGKDFSEDTDFHETLYFFVIPISTFIFKTTDIFIYTTFSFFIFMILIFAVKTKNLKMIVINVKVGFIYYLVFLVSVVTSIIFLSNYGNTDVLKFSYDFVNKSYNSFSFLLFYFVPLLFLLIFPFNIFIFDFLMSINFKQLSLLILLITFPSVNFVNRLLFITPQNIIESLFILSLLSYSISTILFLNSKTKFFRTLLFFTLINEVNFLMLFQHRFKTFVDSGFILFYLGLSFSFLYSLSKLNLENEENLKNSFIKQPTNSIIFFLTSFSFTSLPFSIIFFYQYRFLLILYNYEKLFFWWYLIIIILKTYAILKFDLKMLLVEKKGNSNLINIIKNFQRTDFMILLLIIVLSALFYHNSINKKKQYFGEYRNLYNIDYNIQRETDK